MREISMMTDDELAADSGLPMITPDYWPKCESIIRFEAQKLKPAVEEYLSREDLMADAVVRDIVREYRIYQEILDRIKTREGA